MPQTGGYGQNGQGSRKPWSPQGGAKFSGGGKFGGKGGKFGGPPPWAKPMASDSLRASSMVGGGARAVPHREALMLQVLLTHPWLIEDHAEEIAQLTFSLPVLGQLRDALLSCAAAISHDSGNSNENSTQPLDSLSMRNQLERLSLGEVVDLISQSITHKSDRFAKSDADKAEVEAGWCHALALHERQLELERQLDVAETDWHSEGSEAAFVRICEIKQLIASSNVTEPSTDI
jgi:DNA primase